MTAIVGVAARGHVWIGGDSSAGSEGGIAISRTPKVWTAAPGLVIGFAGDSAECAALRNRLEIHRPLRAPVERWLATEFVDAVRAALEAHGEADTKEWGMLVGVAGGGLWEVAVGGVDACGPYGAQGSAWLVALGALAVTAAAPPETRCRWALEACAKHHTDVRAPFVVMRT